MRPRGSAQELERRRRQAVALLQEDLKPAARWAAVRAMAQIGGPDAQPAVDFMIRALPRATEVEGYNMMVYLALLGPVAAARPSLRKALASAPTEREQRLLKWSLRRTAPEE